MSGSKHFDRVALVVTALMLALTVLFMNGAALGLKTAAQTMGYEDRLFDNTKVHTIDIVMNDWESFIDSAASEEYSAANVVIDGEAYKNVGIRAKGNTSLSTVATLGSERYSFKIEFDHYDSSKSYHGLDKLSLNNLIQDSTMMKDYLTYTMMNAFGVNSSLCSYVYITVNGEDWGLYLAVEGVEEAFLQRNYGADYGELYKPDSMSFGGGRGNGKDFDMDDFDFDAADTAQSENGGAMPSFGGEKGGGFNFSVDESTVREMFEEAGLDTSLLEGVDFDNITPETLSSVMQSVGIGELMKLAQQFMQKGGADFGGGMGMGSDDVKLQYIDDNLNSYSNIWDNAKTDVTEADQTRLVESLKKLQDCADIESVVDAEQVIRYFVVHNYVCNGDSYTGSMVHNYYLYEKDGKLAMIPWDYNLAFGTFQGGNADSTVNTPIDAPIENGSGEDRPMWNWILSDESYTAQYHQYFAEFLRDVDIDGIIDNAYALIKDYVAKDPTAFYSYDEFEKGVETLRSFCALRSESISAQLENGETAEQMNYADASSLTLSDMGSMGGGMGGGMAPNMPDDRGNGNQGGKMPDDRGNGDFGGAMPEKKENETANGAAPTDFGAQPPSAPEGDAGNNMPSGFAAPDFPSDFDPSDMQGDFGGDFPAQPAGNVTADAQTGDVGSGKGDAAAPADTNRPSDGDMQKPNGNMQKPDGDMQAPDGKGEFDKGKTPASAFDAATLIWLAASVAVLALGLFAAKKFKV